jgi:superfamily II DNA or RNA helicase
MSEHTTFSPSHSQPSFTRLYLNPNKVEDYRTFLRVKRLPRFRIVGGFVAEFPSEYAADLGLAAPGEDAERYCPVRGLFDYQRDIAALACRKKKFAVFADCGLGKTLILLEFARHCLRVLPRDRRILIVSPLMVIRQTLAEVVRFYGKGLPIEHVPANRLQAWLRGDAVSVTGAVGVTNYEALTDELEPGDLGALILDESSYLKSHYGKWGQTIIRVGKGLEYKLALTGTPAPNDRIEYANHAVFLDAFPTVNSFLARYFVNRGQTDNRWELKPHALGPFYRSLSHWCIFLTNPATYGWKDNVASIPPINVHIHDVDLTDDQHAAVYRETRTLFVDSVGGITKRSKLAQIAKGRSGGAEVQTRKPQFIRDLVDSWPGESTIIWCLYNHEQEGLEAIFPEAASLKGDTPYPERERAVAEFKAGTRRVLISKPKVLGYGLNLQIATRQVFSGLQDSYESFYQAVKRSNRVGSTVPLNVHIPITEVERPMIETVLRKASRVQRDAEEQERIFKEFRHAN